MMMLLNTSPQSEEIPMFWRLPPHFFRVFIGRQTYKSGTDVPTKSSLSKPKAQLPPKKYTNKHQPQFNSVVQPLQGFRLVLWKIGPHLHRLHQPFCFCSLPAGGSAGSETKKTWKRMAVKNT